MNEYCYTKWSRLILIPELIYIKLSSLFAIRWCKIQYSTRNLSQRTFLERVLWVLSLLEHLRRDTQRVITPGSNAGSAILNHSHFTAVTVCSINGQCVPCCILDQIWATEMNVFAYTRSIWEKVKLRSRLKSWLPSAWESKCVTDEK